MLESLCSSDHSPGGGPPSPDLHAGSNDESLVSNTHSASEKGSFRYRPKAVFREGVGNSQNASEMRQKCVRNASKWVLFYWEKRNVQNASEIRQNCVKNASKIRGTPLGENTFWTIPIFWKRGLFSNNGFAETQEFRDFRDFREPRDPRTWKTNHSPEVLQHFEILGILLKQPLFPFLTHARHT